MSILVAINPKTEYRFDRMVGLGPHTVRLRPAPHCRTPIRSYSLRIEPEDHFINWQQDPFGNYLARLVFPEKAKKLSVEVDVIADGPTNQRLAMSIRTENQVDKEIRNLLDECYSEAVAILSNERLFLSVLADILMQVETVDGEEFDIIYSCSVKKKYEFQMENEPVDACETGAVQA